MLAYGYPTCGWRRRNAAPRFLTATRLRGSEARNPRAVLDCAYLFRLLARLTGRFLTQCQWHYCVERRNSRACDSVIWVTTLGWQWALCYCSRLWTLDSTLVSLQQPKLRQFSLCLQPACYVALVAEIPVQVRIRKKWRRSIPPCSFENNDCLS